eukprot:6206839-Pleurochrysis_carterae.AAC.1
MLAHPDLHDPLAEYVMMTNASDVAAGANQPAEPPAPSADTFAAMHKARRAAGHKLVVLGYYSNTFDPTRRRWADFDKEAGSVVMACSHWYRLITGRPTTVYTDNKMAANILTNFKCPRPPRLQRWGIELGSYLPYLRIKYRMGSLNVVADLMSRYPLDLKEGEHSVAITPDDLFDVLASMEVKGKPAVCLCEPRNQKDIETIWEAEAACLSAQLALLGEYHQAAIADDEKLEAIRTDDRLPACVRQLPRELIEHLATLDVAPEFEGSDVHCNGLLGTARRQWLAAEAEFAEEQRTAEEEMTYWERYVTAFRTLYGRPPVVSDFFCREGTFIVAERFWQALRSSASIFRTGHVRSGCGRYPDWERQDLTQDEFWQHLESKGYAPDCARPDIIHASPPCKEHSGVRFLDSDLMGPEPEPHAELL